MFLSRTCCPAPLLPAPTPAPAPPLHVSQPSRLGNFTPAHTPIKRIGTEIRTKGISLKCEDISLDDNTKGRLFILYSVFGDSGTTDIGTTGIVTTGIGTTVIGHNCYWHNCYHYTVQLILAYSCYRAQLLSAQLLSPYN